MQSPCHLKFKLTHYRLLGKESARFHPTQKPLKLAKTLIAIYGKNSNTILDPYMGVGTFLVAAKELGKFCVGIEKSERDCELAARRLQQEVMFGIKD